MPLQFTTVEEPSFDRGIDARSAENQIKAGFVRDLVNMDIIEGRLRKRRGYGSYSGNIPVRVISFTQTNGSDKLSFRLDSSIDLARITPGPILVWGKSSTIGSGTGPFTTGSNNSRYYTTWESNLRKVFAANTSSGTISAPYTEHNIDSNDLFVGLATSDTGDDLSGTAIFSSDVVINATSKDITVTYDNNTSTAQNVFLYYRDQSSVLGQSSIHTFTPLSAGSHTETITAASHGLDNYNITYQLYEDDGTDLKQVKPESFTVDSSSGTVIVTVNKFQIANYKLILASVPVSQVASTSIAQPQQQVTILDVNNPYLFFTVYRVSGTTWEEVIVDSAVFDDEDKQWTLTWTADPSYTSTFEIVYEYGTVRTNEISVTDSLITTTGSDSLPQLVIYGLNHQDIYGDEKNSDRKGWVTHIDSYKAPAITHVVAGLGGNLFAALDANSSPSSVLFPELFANLNARVSNTAQKIGPAFCEIGENSGRTRGQYAFSGGLSRWAVVTEVTYSVSTGHTTYKLQMPFATKTGTPIAAGDYLTIEKMSHSRHSGSFEIISYDDSTLANNINSYMTVTVDNPKLTSVDYNDIGTAGQGGVFTDNITLSANSPFIGVTNITIGDTLLSSAWGEETELVVQSSSSTSSVIKVSNCFDFHELSAGLILTGKRTSATIPLRTISQVAQVSPIVAGDVLSCSLLERELTVLSVDTTNKTVTVDEAFTWYDNLAVPPAFNIARKWFPIETPTRDSTDTLIPLTTVRHFESNPYSNQPFLRSAMVRNNMYLTNGDDEVYKYDGEHIYRAGLIPWQPGLFATAENVAGGGIALAPIELTGAIIEGKTIKVAAAQAAKVNNGDILRITLSTGLVQDLTIAEKTISSTDIFISFTEPFTVPVGATISSVLGAYIASYFFRLNVKDRNGVETASAVSGGQSFIVTLVPTSTASQKVLLRLVGLPAWDQYDYRGGNVELQIYRSAWSTSSLGSVPLAYRLKTIPLTFETNSGYIDFEDVYSNAALSEEDTDLIARSLSPTEIPVDWDEPSRAKYVTTTGNRLILANIKDWPTLTVNFLANKDTTAASFNGQKFLFRKDYTDTDTATNMVDRVTYELCLSTDVNKVRTIYPLTSSINTFRFESTTALPGGLAAGSWVYLYHGTSSAGSSVGVTANTSNDEFTVASGSAPANNTLITFTSSTNQLPGGIVAGKGYYVINSATNKFQVSETYGGTFVDITTAGANVVAIWDGSELTYTGWWQLAAAPVGNVITINDTDSHITVTPRQFPDRALFATNKKDVPVLVDIDGNLGMSTGNGPVPYINVIRRLGLAINATMRVTDTTLAGQTTFVPWLTAQSEASTGGQLIVKRPRAESITPSLQVIDSPITYQTYINAEVAPNTAVTAITTRYPSRVVISYDNYPEIFSNPYTDNLLLSSSAVDINAADGQEITGIIPFFGSSAFGASQQQAYLIVFKQNSIYLVNVNTREVQKLETQGLGCTAPYSIAYTQDGIAFANESGIYALRRDLRVDYIGKFMERNWKGTVDFTDLSVVQGHNYSSGRQYKLSVPLIDNAVGSYNQNAEVYTYSYTSEGDGIFGGWSRYTNHPATGWANLYDDAFFADVNGNVQRVRNLKENSDYRDGSSAIESSVETRPTAFENTAIRKAVGSVVVHYRSQVNSSSTSLSMAIDMANEYQVSTAYKVVTSGINDGLSSTISKSVVSVMHSFPRRKCIYAGVKIVNTGKDENVEIAGMSYVVAGLSSSGVKQAEETN